MGFPKLKTRIVLAPMAGITDVAFRIVCKEFGAGLVYTEMISANALSRGNAATIKIAKTCDKEKPVSMQLFGQNTESFTKCIDFVEKNADILDINLGCPAQQVMKQGAGCALLKRENKVKEILDELLSVSKIPITVKIRAGTSRNTINAVQIAKMCERCGVGAIAIHARTFSQGYSGKADWNHIKAVKDNVSIPVIGNGDVCCAEDVKKMLDETGCNYVMIGRAAMGNPYLIKQAVNYLETGKVVPDLELAEQIKILYHYFDILKKHGLEDVKRMKSAAQRFTKRFVGSSKVRFKLNNAKSEKDVVEIMEWFRDKS